LKIVNLYNIYGNYWFLLLIFFKFIIIVILIFILGIVIFKSYTQLNENNKDLFQPIELNINKQNNRASSKLSAKLRKPSRILKTTKITVNSTSKQKRNTKKISVMQRYY